MTPLTSEAARALLSDAFGVASDLELIRCRVNFFESAFLALPPGAVLLVRQDMMGRRHTHLLEVEVLQEVEVIQPRRKQKALRFRVGEVVWQIDRVPATHWDELWLHVSRAAMAAEGPPAEAAPPKATPPPTPRAAPVATEAFLPSGGAPDAMFDMEYAGAVIVSTPARETPPPPGVEAAPVAAEALLPSGGQPAEHRPPPPTPVDELLAFLDDAILADPTPDGLAPVLRKLFHQSQALEQADRALMAAQSLLALGKAGPLERQHAERYQSPKLLEADRPLTAAHWAAVQDMHEADRALMGVTAALRPALVRMTARSPRDYGLKGQTEGAQKLVFGRVFEYVRRMLALPDVRYHPHLEGPKGIRFANLSHDGQWMPTLVVGADFLSGHAEIDLAFRIAHELTFLRPEHLLRVLTPELPQQAVLVLTAVAMAEPDQPIAGDQEQAIKTQLSHLSKYMEIDDFEAVSEAVRGLLHQTEPFDLLRWNRGVERAALRLGLVLCGDVQVASHGLRDESASHSDALAVRAELFRFAVGDLHQEIRRDLGLAIAE